MTDNTFESLFESLDETELQTLVNAGVNVDASATRSEKKRLYHLTKKDTEPVRRLPKGRTVKTVLLAAAAAATTGAPEWVVAWPPGPNTSINSRRPNRAEMGSEPLAPLAAANRSGMMP